MRLLRDVFLEVGAMNIMSLIKEHRYESICVALALLLLLALWPALKLGAKAKAMAEQAGDLASTLARLERGSSNGVVANKERIKARRQLADQVELESRQIKALFKQINQREFLVAGMFPGSEDPFGFKDEYRKAIRGFRDQTLKAGWPHERPGGGKAKSPSEIGVYVESLDDLGVPEWVKASDAPDSQKCWFGQVSFWIQEDLVQLISDLNRASAKRVGQEPSVSNATVKHISYLEIEDSYYVSDTPSSASGVPRTSTTARRGGPRPGPGSFDPFGMPGRGGFGQYPIPTTAPRRGQRRRGKVPTKAFTEHSSNDQTDVLHFSFSVVIDSRYINEFLVLFSRKNLYTVLNISLSREDVQINKSDFASFDKTENFSPSRDAKVDLVYGTDPIIRLNIDAELLLLREVYSEDMPGQVKKAVEQQIAQVKALLQQSRQQIGGRRGR